MRDFVGNTAATAELVGRLVEFVRKFLPPEHALHRVPADAKVCWG
jgi:hypothetical protein